MTGVPISELEKLAAEWEKLAFIIQDAGDSRAGGARYSSAYQLRALIARHSAPWDGRVELKPARPAGWLGEPAALQSEEQA